MSQNYDGFIASAKLIVEEHNANGGDVNFDAFIAALKKMGGTSVAALRGVSFEDLQECGLPKLVARQVASSFRAKDDESGEGATSKAGETGEGTKVVSAKKAAAMTPKELIERYDPRDSDNAVGRRLKELSSAKRCIVFNEDGSVNVDVSVKLLGEIRDGFGDRDTYVDGTSKPKSIYRIGERPNQLADENPLYRGRALRPDGNCDQTNRSWSGVDPKVRILMRLAIDSGELRIGRIDDAHSAIDLAISPDAESKIRARYTGASIKYDELAESGGLPTLKVKLTGVGASASGRTENPFAVTGNRVS